MDSNSLQLATQCACESISHQKTPTQFSSDFCQRAEALCLYCSAFPQLSWNELVYKEFTSSLGRTGSFGGALFGPTSMSALARFPKAQHCWSWLCHSALKLFCASFISSIIWGFDILRPWIGNKSSMNFSYFFLLLDTSESSGKRSLNRGNTSIRLAGLMVGNSVLHFLD